MNPNEIREVLERLLRVLVDQMEETTRLSELVSRIPLNELPRWRSQIREGIERIIRRLRTIRRMLRRLGNQTTLRNNSRESIRQARTEIGEAMNDLTRGEFNEASENLRNAAGEIANEVGLN